MHRYKVYYDDNSALDSELTKIEDLPVFGVIFIVQSHGSCIVHGNDFFYLNEDDGYPNWRQIDWSGILDRLLHRKPVNYLLQGRQVSNEKFSELFLKVRDEALEYKRGK